MRRHLLAAAALLLVVGLAYADSFKAGFVYDSDILLQKDPRIQTASWHNVREILTTNYWGEVGVSGLYRPVTTLSYMFNYSVLGNADRPAGYHAVNLLLHESNVLLVYVLVFVLVGSRALAFLAAAVFGVHPITTEAVTNLVGRGDLLAALSVFAGLLLYISSTRSSGTRRIACLAALSLVAFLGMLCKENAGVIVGVVFLYDLTWRLERLHPNPLVSLGRNLRVFFLRGYAVLVPPVLLVWLIRLRVFSSLPSPLILPLDNPLVEAGFWSGRLTAVKVIGKFLRLLVWPARLSPDYSYNQVPVVRWPPRGWEDLSAFLALAIVAGALAAALWGIGRCKPLFFFILFFFGTYFPTSNLLVTIGSIMAERFLYLPSVGFAGVAALAVTALARRLAPGRFLPRPLQGRAGTLSLVLAAPLLAALGARTCVRNLDWRDEVTLWTKALETSPQSARVHNSLAVALAVRYPPVSIVDRLISLDEKALAIRPDDQKALRELGEYYRVKGDALVRSGPGGPPAPSEESRAWYLKSLDVLERARGLAREDDRRFRDEEARRGRRLRRSETPRYYLDRSVGITCMRLARYDEALDAFHDALEVAPLNAETYAVLAAIQDSAGRPEEAIVARMQMHIVQRSPAATSPPLIALYRKVAPDGCALLERGGRVALNPDCPLVRRHRCEALEGLATVLRKAGRGDMAEGTLRQARSEGCAAGGGG